MAYTTIRATTGDSLASLAKKYGTTVAALVAANPQLKRSNGQVIVYSNSNVHIPSTPPKLPAVPSIVSNGPVPMPNPSTMQTPLTPAVYAPGYTPPVTAPANPIDDRTTATLDLSGQGMAGYLNNATDNTTNLLQGQADILRQARKDQGLADADVRNSQVSQYNAGVRATGSLAGQHGISGGGGLDVAARRASAIPYNAQQLSSMGQLQAKQQALNTLTQKYITDYQKNQQKNNQAAMNTTEIYNRLINNKGATR